MPEYLHPGVYIQETSYRGVPIEGVSTSTVGLVGRCTKGPEGDATLVTSFTEYRRTFGDPVPIQPGVLGKPGDYLGQAVRAFFENGGLRAYIVRVLDDATAAAAKGFAGSGLVPVLADTKLLRASTVAITLQLVSTRGLAVGDKLEVFVRPDANSPFVNTGTLGAITAIDPIGQTVTVPSIATTILGPGATSASSVVSSNVYFEVSGAPPITTGAPTTCTQIVAKYRGTSGNDVSVAFRAADRTPVTATAAVTANKTVPVSSVSPFYPGAIVEMVGPATPMTWGTVSAMDPVARTVTLDAVVTLKANDTLRVLELDVLVYEAGVGGRDVRGPVVEPGARRRFALLRFAGQRSDERLRCHPAHRADSGGAADLARHAGRGQQAARAGAVGRIAGAAARGRRRW